LNWIKEFENKGIKIQLIRTDGGGELEGYLKPVLTSLGIAHQPTAPYTPQSNGKAERLNRTLGQACRAMLYHANMPATFWAKAMTIAAFVINFLPSQAVNNQIPWELWHGKEVSIDTLRKLHPFGSIVHDYIPYSRRSTEGKLAVRATVGCCVGFQLSITHESTASYKF
jgi:transposase InsO family protein